MRRSRFLFCVLSIAICLPLIATRKAYGAGFDISSYFAGLGPTSVAAGDFNGDGHPDLVLVGSCPDNLCDLGSVTVLLGKGDGTFRNHKQFRGGPAGTTASFVTTGDFNRDGKLDLLVLNHTETPTGDASVLLGNGDGTFQAPVLYDTAALLPVTAVVGDFNGDGVPDVAITDTIANSLDVLLGNGDGSFTDPVTYAAGTSADGLAVADFNGDGKLDLAVVSCGMSFACHGTVAIFLGNGDGTFHSDQRFVPGLFPVNVAVADFNGDGHPDLVVTLPCGEDGSCETNGGVSILLGNGDGTFQHFSFYRATGESTLGVAVGDFNGDHQADVAALDWATNDMTLFLGNGDGTLQKGMHLKLSGVPFGIVIADLNHDAAPDIAIANESRDSVTVLLNTEAQ